MRLSMLKTLLATAGVLIGGLACAQGYPAKPIRLVVPYPAGGATDFFARLVFPKMGEALGQSVVVENRPGAGTAIGASEVARSAPDGYTLLLGDAGTYAFNPTLYKKLSYDPVKDFAPISLTGRFALILAVNPSVLKVGSVKELVAMAKSQPGKIDYGAPAGTARDVVMKLNGEFAKVMSDPALKQRLSESGFELQTSSPEEFAAYMKSEIAKWEKVIRESNISLD